MRCVIIILMIILGTAARGQQPFQRVKALMHRNEYKAADKLLDSCARKDHFHDSVLFYRAQLQLRTGNLKDAKKHWRELAKKHAGFGELNFLRGLIAFRETAYARSIDDFSRAIDNNPQHYRAIYNRSLAYGMMDEYLYAIEDLGRLIALNSSDANVFYARAYWYEFTGNYTGSVNDYNQCLQLDPKIFDAYLGLAFSYRQLNEKEKACETINEAIAAGSQVAAELKGTYCD